MLRIADLVSWVSSKCTPKQLTLEQIIVKITAITTSPCALGEGPLWDHDRQRLFWVDAFKQQLFCLTTGGHIRTWQLPSMIGCLAVINRSEILITLQTGLYRYHLETDQLRLIVDPERDQPKTRMNDGKTDRQGQLVFASMGIKDRSQGWGALYRFNRLGVLETLLEDVVVGNGPCFSPDGGWLYFSDGRGTMQRFAYNPNGALGPGELFFDGRHEGLICDGATVDHHGNVWAALIGSSKIGCISPAGELKLTINLPIPLPSSVMFGGPELDLLYVTSISDSGNRRDESPGSGLLYCLSGLRTEGLREAPFKPNFSLY